MDFKTTQNTYQIEFKLLDKEDSCNFEHRTIDYTIIIDFSIINNITNINKLYYAFKTG